MYVICSVAIAMLSVTSHTPSTGPTGPMAYPFDMHHFKRQLSIQASSSYRQHYFHNFIATMNQLTGNLRLLLTPSSVRVAIIAMEPQQCVLCAP